jgi:hypothetical protein
MPCALSAGALRIERSLRCAVKYSDALAENEWYTYPNMNAGEVFPNGAFDPQQAIDCEGRIAR